ncbi:unnamed protein product [Bursaphelenchus okinawaensis]|uniref:Uncharacterized protein n=1 Tax=Bursaphelenchus okinawaensis TaxID=465554 RepID=A0A811KAZ1_9BILA|nr:unnamed protein product [Bursaphelenchus okinawaensis]CAG9098261.1 unnamed protein product [Bursaphelenchus okinawaensis]
MITVILCLFLVHSVIGLQYKLGQSCSAEEEDSVFCGYDTIFHSWSCCGEAQKCCWFFEIFFYAMLCTLILLFLGCIGCSMMNSFQQKIPKEDKFFY